MQHTHRHSACCPSFYQEVGPASSGGVTRHVCFTSATKRRRQPNNESCNRCDTDIHPRLQRPSLRVSYQLPHSPHVEPQEGPAPTLPLLEHPHHPYASNQALYPYPFRTCRATERISLVLMMTLHVPHNEQRSRISKHAVYAQSCLRTKMTAIQQLQPHFAPRTLFKSYNEHAAKERPTQVSHTTPTSKHLRCILNL